MDSDTKVINKGKREEFIIRRHMKLKLGSSMANCFVPIETPKHETYKLRINKDFKVFTN